MIFEKKEGRPLDSWNFDLKLHCQIQRIKEPYCKDFKLLSAKMWNFLIFPRRNMRVAYICFFVFVFLLVYFFVVSCQ